jgi:hypothetical protein
MAKGAEGRGLNAAVRACASVLTPVRLVPRQALNGPDFKQRKGGVKAKADWRRGRGLIPPHPAAGAYDSEELHMGDSFDVGVGSGCDWEVRAGPDRAAAPTQRRPAAVPPQQPAALQRRGGALDHPLSLPRRRPGTGAAGDRLYPARTPGSSPARPEGAAAGGGCALLEG